MILTKFKPHLRFITKDRFHTVVVESASDDFYREDKALAGNKMKVYVVSKILRKCTETDITSFKVK